jgi:cytoskeletal protein CcmA (bactofilin family)
MEENNKPVTVILAGTKIEGKITGHSDMVIEGEISGEVNLDSNITIAEGGKSDAEINVENIVVEGEHHGNIVARECIQIAPSGKVKAELRAPAISIEKGAKFSGNIDMVFNG